MRTSRYEVFLKIVETQSLTKTAAYFGCTQSAVSQLVKALETELGVSLLIRSKAGVRLTAFSALGGPFYYDIDDRGNMVVRNIFPSQEEAELAGSQWQGAGEPGKWLYPALNPTTHRWGYVNYYGEWKFPAEYQDAGFFLGEEPLSFAAIKTDERWGCIDAKGILIINNVFDSREDAEAAGLQWISGLNYETWRMPATNAKTGQYGVVNYLGRWMLPATYENIGHFGKDNFHAYTQAKIDGRWGNIDRNGNIISNESYVDTKRQLFNGTCMAILRAGRTAGPVTLTASMPGMKPVTLKLITNNN